MRPFRFGLQVGGEAPDGLATTAARAEALGFDVVLVPDHVGSDWSPMLCLTAAALATERIRLGTFVLNANFYNPVMLARDVATLDQVSGGRVELGLGAGHTPAEFAATGTSLDPPGRRKTRLASFTTIVRRLLNGDDVDHHDEFYDLTAASVAIRAGSDGTTERVRPTAQDRLPLMVGVSGRPALAHAATHADIIGFHGLGATLPDGHRHAVRFHTSLLDDQLSIVREAAGTRFSTLELNVLVQAVTITDDRERAAHDLVDRIEGLTVDDALATPYLALGTVEEIAAHLTATRERWGLSYFVVRDAEAFAPVIAALRG